MNRYEKRKATVRDEAIEWQYNLENENYPYDTGALIERANYFEKLGRRYGLLREFRENGIC